MTIQALEGTPFIGRRRELTELRQAVAASRLVTLVGSGGVGKTRLATRVMREVSERFPGGTWLVELADVTDPSLVSLTIADALGLRAQPGEDQLALVAAYVAERATLLVLDNCEHLLGATADAAAELLDGAPELRFLCTSRQPLGVLGEQVYRVPPLSVPDLRGSPDRISESEAVTLFVDRAARALPEFELTDENREAVAHLCVALEGLPMGIELAAARVPVLSPEEILERFRDRYQQLTQTARDISARQRSLETSVAWSHDLCTPGEQLLWMRLSVFVGGFSLSAAEEVCSGDGIERESVLDLIAGLVEKSIIFRDVGVERTHFRMLEIIRHYGARQLASSPDPDRWRLRHMNYFAALAQRFRAEWSGPEQPRLVTSIRINHGNLQTCLEQALSTPETSVVALRVVADLESFWLLTGQFTEAHHWLTLALAAGTGTPTERAVALCQCSFLSAAQMELDTAAPEVEAAAALASTVPVEHPRRQEVSARIEASKAMVALFDGRTEEAAGHADSARRTFDELGLTSEYLLVTIVGSLALGALERPDEAEKIRSEALARTDLLGEFYFKSYMLWSWALEARTRGELDAAEAALKDALALKLPLGDDVGEALCLEGLAAVASEMDQPVRSATLLGAASSLWRRVGVIAVSAPYVAAQREIGEQLSRGSLKGTKFAEAYHRGEVLSPEEVMDFALTTQKDAGEDATDPLARLTPREREVALLVSEGMTNQQIADALFVSLRTAQGHVENILRKLTLSSRTQVASFVLRGGLG